MTKEQVTCQSCSAEYYILWNDDLEDDYGNLVEPEYCPFCGSSHICVEEEQLFKED